MKKRRFLFLMFCAALFVLCTPNVSAASSAKKIDLYFLDDIYRNYISIPTGFKTKYKLPLDGKKSDYYFDIDGDTVTVSDKLVVEPAFDDVFSIGLVDSSASSRKEYLQGKTVVKATSKKTGKVSTFEFNSRSYSEYYVNKKMNDYVKSNINSSMSDKQKLEKICEFVCRYPYHNRYSDAETMIVIGEGGDCWASADAIIQMAEIVGLKARLTEAEYVSMFSGGHLYPIVSVGKQYAIVEANIEGKVLVSNDKVFSCERSYSISYSDIPLAYSYYYDEDIDDYKIQIDAYLGFGGYVTIPEKIDGKTVARIGDGCFYHSERYLDKDSKITGVKLPDTIEAIESLAFNECEKIKSVNLPASVKTIGRLAFGACSSLTLTVDKNNKYFYSDNKTGILYSKDMSTLFFAFNLKVKNLKIPNGVRVIKDAAFWNEDLETVTFPETLEEIEYCAFAHCDLSGYDIVLPKSVSALGYGVFYGTNPGSITIVNPKCVINNTKENDLCEKEDGATLGGGSKIVIYADEGSTAQAYVKKFGVDVIHWSDGTVEKRQVYIFKKLCSSLLETGKHSWGKEKVTKKASCTEKGSKTYKCSVCGETKTESIAKLGHKYVKTVTKATLSKDGKIVSKCSVCKATVTKKISKVSKISLSTTKYTYNGKTRKPGVTVKTSDGKTLKNGTDYTVSYSDGRKNVGKYSVKIKFKGNYSGSKTLNFKINPKTVKLKTIDVGKKKMTVRWNKETVQTTGYEIQYSTSSSFKSDVKVIPVSKNKTTSRLIKGLKTGKKYYVRIRTYKVVDGKNYYSSWSKKMSVKAK